MKRMWREWEEKRERKISLVYELKPFAHQLTKQILRSLSKSQVGLEGNFKGVFTLDLSKGVQIFAWIQLFRECLKY